MKGFTPVNVEIRWRTKEKEESENARMQLIMLSLRVGGPRSRIMWVQQKAALQFTKFI